jgi:hypothetical protein
LVKNAFRTSSTEEAWLPDHSHKPKLRGSTPAEVALALDDGVKHGHISGTATVAAMKALERKR